MAKRTYTPQLARILQRVAVYYARHKTAIDPTIAGQGTLAADLQTIVNTINNANGWGSVNVKSQP